MMTDDGLHCRTGSPVSRFPKTVSVRAGDNRIVGTVSPLRFEVSAVERQFLKEGPYRAVRCVLGVHLSPLIIIQRPPLAGGVGGYNHHCIGEEDGVEASLPLRPPCPCHPKNSWKFLE